MLAMASPLLTSCASPAPEHSVASSEANDATFALVNGWAKAGEAGGMTGVFGTLVNNGQDALTIDRIESDAAKSVELHEVVDGMMREIEGNTTIDSGAEFELAPGANHIMLMGLTAPLLAGGEVNLTIYFEGGKSFPLRVMVKEYAGADEEYSH